jgi:hypothetical protein
MRSDTASDQTNNSQETTSRTRWQTPRLVRLDAADAEGTPGASNDSQVTTS